jgi:hypothetical protein
MFVKKLILASLLAVAPLAAEAAPVRVLFVGNSYTFGHHDPALRYNAAAVTDLTAPSRGGPFANNNPPRPYQPRPWGGVAGIFKQFTDQAGLDYEVSHSTRNAASLRGHFLESNPDGWTMRNNIAEQTWDKVVLQEQSDDALARRTNANNVTLAGNPEYFRFYSDTIRKFVQSTAPIPAFRDLERFPGSTDAERTAACRAAGNSLTNCETVRGPFSNANADPGTEVYLYQTWARPNLVDGAFVTTTNLMTGEITRSATPSLGTFFPDLESMTAELKAAFETAVAGGGFAGVAPVGEAFLRAVQTGVATRDMWADDALTDGLIDLWHLDGTHASRFGSYLSALVLFGELTGLDPASLGAGERAARELGIGRAQARQLQRVASDQLGFVAPVPLPATGALALAGLALLHVVARRRRAGN